MEGGEGVDSGVGVWGLDFLGVGVPSMLFCFLFALASTFLWRTEGILARSTVSNNKINWEIMRILPNIAIT